MEAVAEAHLPEDALLCVLLQCDPFTLVRGCSTLCKRLNALIASQPQLQAMVDLVPRSTFVIFFISCDNPAPCET